MVTAPEALRNRAVDATGIAPNSLTPPSSAP